MNKHAREQLGSVKNTQHSLHPGMFADVYFHFETEQAVLAVPENALTRSADGFNCSLLMTMVALSQK